jgi:hypothetical protein
MMHIQKERRNSTVIPILQKLLVASVDSSSRFGFERLGLGLGPGCQLGHCLGRLAG